MKSLFGFLAIAVAFAASQTATADVITSAVVSDGTKETTFDTSSDDPVYTGTSAVLQEFTAGGVTYTSLIAPDSFVGDVEGILYDLGGTAPAGSVPDAPTPALGALSDLDLSTGGLDPHGTSTFTALEYWDFSSQTITNETVFFLFNNGTPTGTVVLVDSSGAAISNVLSLAALGGEEELNDFGFSRTNGGDLASRDVAGNVFAVSEFTLNVGSTIADIAGFRGSGGTFDAQDAGIAVATPAEPSGPVCFTSSDRFLIVGDSFVNADDEWGGRVRDTGVFAGVDIEASGGWPLFNNIRNAALNNYDPNIHSAVVVAGGVNDLADSHTLAQMQEATQAIINDTLAGGGHIILVTVAPFRQVQGRVGGNPSFFTEAREDQADAYDAWVKGLANSSDSISVFDLRAVLDPDGDGNADLDLIRGNPDLLHPDDNGSQALADAFIEQFATFTSGDVNRDGVVNFLDIGPFIIVLGSGEFRKEADVNQDGSINFLDISPFISLLSQ